MRKAEASKDPSKSLVSFSLILFLVVRIVGASNNPDLGIFGLALVDRNAWLGFDVESEMKPTRLAIKEDSPR